MPRKPKRLSLEEIEHYLIAFLPLERSQFKNCTCQVSFFTLRSTYIATAHDPWTAYQYLAELIYSDKDAREYITHMWQSVS